MRKLAFDRQIEIIELAVLNRSAVLVRGEVANTGSEVWLNNNLDITSNDYRIRLRIVDSAHHVIEEWRALLPQKEILLEESFSFSSFHRCQHLLEGLFFLDIDIIRESNFAFIDQGAQPFFAKVPSYGDPQHLNLHSTIREISLTELPNNSLLVRGLLVNSGLSAWPLIPINDRSLKIVLGARVYDKYDMQLWEGRVRASCSVLPSGHSTSFSLLLSRALFVDHASLKLSLLIEGCLWLDELGIAPTWIYI